MPSPTTFKIYAIKQNNKYPAILFTEDEGVPDLDLDSDSQLDFVGDLVFPDPVYPKSYVFYHKLRELLYLRDYKDLTKEAMFPENVTTLRDFIIMSVEDFKDYLNGNGDDNEDEHSEVIFEEAKFVVFKEPEDYSVLSDTHLEIHTTGNGPIHHVFGTLTNFDDLADEIKHLPFNVVNPYGRLIFAFTTPGETLASIRSTFLDKFDPASEIFSFPEGDDATFNYAIEFEETDYTELSEKTVYIVTNKDTYNFQLPVCDETTTPGQMATAFKDSLGALVDVDDDIVYFTDISERILEIGVDDFAFAFSLLGVDLTE